MAFGRSLSRAKRELPVANPREGHGNYKGYTPRGIKIEADGVQEGKYASVDPESDTADNAKS